MLVTGSRWWSDEDIIREAITKFQPKQVLVGDAPGADTICARVCGQQGINVRIFPAFWNRYGLHAGPKRNQEMVDQEPDLVLAFLHPESKGTQDTIRRAKQAGIPVVSYDWTHGQG